MLKSELISDCENCIGLCCVAPPFAKSKEFAFSKGEGQACQHLGDDNRCTIHDDLNAKGFSGCVKFECYGAGQKVTNHHFKGQSWHDDHLTAKRMFHAFFIVKALHQRIIELGNEDSIRNSNKIKELETLSLAAEEELLQTDLTDL